jgi:hypothetical protein
MALGVSLDDWVAYTTNHDSNVTSMRYLRQIPRGNMMVPGCILLIAFTVWVWDAMRAHFWGCFCLLALFVSSFADLLDNR